MYQTACFILFTMKAIRSYKNVSIVMFVLALFILVISLLVGLLNKSANIARLIGDCAIGVSVFALIGVIFLFIFVIKYDNKNIYIKYFPWLKPSIIEKDNIDYLRWNIETTKPSRGKVNLLIILKKADTDGYNKIELSIPNQKILLALFSSHPHLTKNLLQ